MTSKSYDKGFHLRDREIEALIALIFWKVLKFENKFTSCNRKTEPDEVTLSLRAGIFFHICWDSRMFY